MSAFPKPFPGPQIKGHQLYHAHNFVYFTDQVGNGPLPKLIFIQHSISEAGSTHVGTRREGLVVQVERWPVRDLSVCEFQEVHFQRVPKGSNA